MAQPHSTSDTLAVGRRVVTDEQDNINGRNTFAYLVMRGKKFRLLRAHAIVMHECGTNASANLDEDIFTGTDGGNLFRRRSIGQHPIKEGGQRHAASKRFNVLKIRPR